MYYKTHFKSSLRDFGKIIRISKYSINKFLAKIFKIRTTAETIAEVIIALMVLSVGATGAMTVVSMSISATNDGENQIMAYNIAREGVEAIRNIRDTNWLKFPGDHLNCWDTLNATKAQDCVNSIKLSNATYWASLETDPGSNALFKWEVGTEDSNPQTDDFLLYENPVGNDTILNHDPTGVPGIFHRSIALIKGNNTMQITSKVWWESKGRNHEVRFVDELNNY